MKHTENDVSSASWNARERIEVTCARAMAVLLDNERSERTRRLECKCCFYLRSGLAGQAFTEWKCVVCDTQDTWANTSTPRVCVACAKKHSLCVRCGGDIHMRSRRKATLKENEP